uniref:Uncharacterized protein n=1 Tax=viral metagenome TaxID=1070528 RepID=A0A6C0KSJ4_9ZZZZ
MAETVPYKQIKECTDRERHINIISIRSPEKLEIKFDKHYCHFSPPRKIKYELNFVQITDDDLTNIYSLLQMKDVLNDKCNELLIYYENDSQLQPIFLHILSLFKSFPLKKTVYLADEENESEVLTTYPDFLSTYKFVLFITLPESELYYHTEETSFGLKKIITKSLPNNLKLTCQIWFKKFISRIFSCGVKRLLQKSGTCYLTAVINGIVLSPVLQNFFLQKMKEYVTLYPESKVYISSPLNELDMTNCKRFLGNYSEEVQFLYRMLYNLVCKDVRPFAPVHYSLREDVFVQASKDYFSTSVLGQGGFGIVPILSFLYGSSTNFVIALEDEMKNIIYINPKDALVYMPTFLSKPLLYNQLYDKLLLNRISYIHSDVSIILYIPRDLWLEDQNVSDIVSEGFTTQSSSIFMSYEKDEISCAHAVVGFFCDGIPKVYDSGTNMIFEADWLGNVSDFYVTYIDTYREMDPLAKLDNFGIEYILFTSALLPQFSDVCFKPEHSARQVTKDLTWDVPHYRLYRENEFTPLFFSLVFNRIPISEDFFDLSKSSIANQVDSNFGIVKMILDAYPTVNFLKYPEVAIIILKDRVFQQDEIEIVPVQIDDIQVLYQIYQDIIIYGIGFTLTNEVIEEAIADGQIQILNQLGVVPVFTDEFMLNSSILEHWNDIYDTYPALPWSDYERMYILKHFRDEYNDEIVMEDFQRLSETEQQVPYRVLRHFERFWPYLQDTLYYIDWQDVESRWNSDPLNLTF